MDIIIYIFLTKIQRNTNEDSANDFPANLWSMHHYLKDVPCVSWRLQISHIPVAKWSRTCDRYTSLLNSSVKNPKKFILEMRRLLEQRLTKKQQVYIWYQISDTVRFNGLFHPPFLYHGPQSWNIIKAGKAHNKVLSFLYWSPFCSQFTPVLHACALWHFLHLEIPWRPKKDGLL